jgi:hypothetical protein
VLSAKVQSRIGAVSSSKLSNLWTFERRDWISGIQCLFDQWDVLFEPPQLSENLNTTPRNAASVAKNFFVQNPSAFRSFFISSIRCSTVARPL